MHTRSRSFRPSCAGHRVSWRTMRAVSVYLGSHHAYLDPIRLTLGDFKPSVQCAFLSPHIIMDQSPPAIPPEQLALLAAENHGPKTIAIVVSFTVLAFLCVVLRFVTRTRLTHLVGWEDYFIAFAMVFSDPVTGNNILLTYASGLLRCYISMSSQASGMGCWQTSNLCRSSLDH